MPTGYHDTLVYRLAQILIKLNQGERLDPRALATEFKVDLRTIQRDLNVRFAYLPLQRSGGRYHLDPAFLGKLSTRDIERFATLAGIRGLFPSLSDEFLQDLLDARMTSALLVIGHHYESISDKEKAFREIENAIVARRRIAFDYARLAVLKSYSSIAPYRLVNSKGIWYLVAIDGDKLKSFSFTKIEKLRVLETTFLWDANIEARIAAEDGIWLSSATQKIVLRIHSTVAEYFKRRRLITNQVIEDEVDNGDLIISAVIGHPNQIMPIVRYWIPHIRIISPVALQEEIESGLVHYLRGGAAPG